MPTQLTIRDESTSGQTVYEFSLDVLTERITVRELIRSRVYQEVKDFNAKRPELFQGLVQPTDAGQTLNGCRLREKRHIDWKKLEVIRFSEPLCRSPAGRCACATAHLAIPGQVAMYRRHLV